MRDARRLPCRVRPSDVRSSVVRLHAGDGSGDRLDRGWGEWHAGGGGRQRRKTTKKESLGLVHERRKKEHEAFHDGRHQHAVNFMEFPSTASKEKDVRDFYAVSKNSLLAKQINEKKALSRKSSKKLPL